MARTVLVPHLGIHVCLGRKPPDPTRKVLHLANYLDRMKALPTAPGTVDWTSKVPSWPMYLNDQLGDCVIADGAHEIGLWTANNSTYTTFSDAQILALYSKLSGYIPGHPNTDQGMQISTMLDYMVTTGFPGGHKIRAWLSVDNSNKDLVKQAIWIFGSITLGIDLPDSWIQNAKPNGVWDVDTPNPYNGHCVPGTGYNTTSSLKTYQASSYNAEGVQIVTWGMVITITWAALMNRRIVSECYVKVPEDWVSEGDPNAPNGLDLAGIISDFNQIGGALPVPNPTPSPVPDPTPTPVPTPTPSPFPPGMRQAIDALFAQLEAKFARRPLILYVLTTAQAIIDAYLDSMGIKYVEMGNQCKAGPGSFPIPISALKQVIDAAFAWALAKYGANQWIQFALSTAQAIIDAYLGTLENTTTWNFQVEVSKG